MRYLTGRGVALLHQFLDDEVVAHPSPVKVSVYAADGTLAYEQDNLTPSGDDYTANAGMLEQGAYRVVWSSPTHIDTTEVEVTGGLLFTIKDARDSDSEIADTGQYPGEEIKHFREVVETEFQTITGRSFVPRTVRVPVETDGSDCAWLGLFDCASLVALEGPDGALVASDYVLEPNGLLNGLSGFSEGTRLTAVVDYGFRFPPEDVKRVGLIRLRYLLAAESTGVPDRATSYVAESGGTFTLATPGRAGYKTGIPEVDAVLNLYSYNVLNDVLAGG